MLLLASVLHGQPGRFGVDSRVELMSIIFRLAESGEYTQGRIPSYNAAIDRHFAAFREHEVVKLARDLRNSDGVSFDAVMNMAVHVKDVETLAERVPFDGESSLGRRWRGIKARKFLEAARAFAKESDFAGFLKSQKPLYDLTDQRLREFVEKNADLAWFDKFFGPLAHAPFIVVPGLVNGPSSYGAHAKLAEGVEEIFAIPGVWQVDAAGMPVFPAEWTSTLVHEFAHSYVGPLIDAHAARLEKAGDRLYAATRSEMNAQAYGSAKTVLNESLVRAATARYAFEHQGADAAKRSVNYERGRSFLWTGELLDALDRYAADRGRYPAVSNFMPQIVDAFDAAAGRVEQMVSGYEASRPKVASLSIVNGAKDVDPGVKEIVVTFDRAMVRSSYAVARTSGVEQPKFGKVSFDESGKVFTIPVTLEPDKEYAFSLNWPGGGSFQSADGVLLKAVEVKFHTRPARP